MDYPEWTKKYCKKGQEIRLINNNYYLYEIKSYWDKNRKKAIKFTKYLGKLDEQNGYTPRHTVNINDKFDIDSNTISVKEYGNVCLVKKEMESIYNDLCKYFDTEVSKYIICLAFFKLVYQSPFKRMQHYYENSYISEIYPNLSFIAKNISTFLNKLGNSRNKIVEFMNDNIGDSKHILFDGCSVISNSNNMDINRVGYNAHHQYDPQINLLYAFSYDKQKPVYYRIVPGNVRDVTSFVDSVNESKLKDVDIVGDKGFGSEVNMKYLEDIGLYYVIPAKRNTKYFDDSILKKGDKKEFDDFFTYNKRIIWYYSKKIDNRYVHTFLDEDLKIKEEKDYIGRIASNIDGYDKDGLFDRQYKFGTIILITNKYEKAKDAYEIYKTRLEIEEMFDSLKNYMEADNSYMQKDISLEGWGFINHIAMILLYTIYEKLRKSDMLERYSAKDLIEYVKVIQQLKINGKWKVANISKKTLDILAKLGIHIA